MEATVIKIGNSHGVRLSQAYLHKIGVKAGDHVDVRIKQIKADRTTALSALAAISKLNGSLANVDIKAWQAARKAKDQATDRQLRDILGR